MKEYKYFFYSIDKFLISSYHNNMKKFSKYFLISILLLAGLFCVGLLYLFFVPNSTLFNITYIGYSEHIETSAYSTETIKTIAINSRAYDINIVEAKGTTVSAVVEAKTFGYVLVKNSDVAVSTNFANETLTIDVTEPHGFAFNSFSSIELRLPKGYSPNLVLKNQKANVIINDEDISISSLTYTSTSGKVDFRKGTLSGELNLNLGKSVFNIHDGVLVTPVNVNLSVTTGKFNATKHEFNAVTVTKNTRGVINIGKCFSFNEKIKTAGGKVALGSVTSLNIESSDTNITVGDLYGGTIILTRTGNVKVKHILGVALIKTNSGSITVDKASSKFATESKTGNQKLSGLTYFVEAISTYGNITATFADDAGDYQIGADVPFRSLTATTTSGKITATGLDHVKILVNDNGRVDVTMRKVLGEGNQIIGKRGEVNVVVANDAIYGLTTESSNGSVYVNVGQFAVNGYNTTERTYNIICPFEGAWVPAGYLEVTTTSGSLRVVDEMNR